MCKIALENTEVYKNWPSLHAPYINTSVDMLGSHYNRGNAHTLAEKTGQMINTALNLVPPQNSAEAIQQHLGDVQFLDNTQDKVVKVIDESHYGPETRFLCVYASGKQEWVEDHLLDPFTDVVLAFFNSFGGEVEEVEPNTNNEAEEVAVDDVPGLESASSVDDQELLDQISDEEPAPVSTCKSRKRKRPTIDDLEEVFLGDRVLKPGDIVSVNPDDPAAEFWLAQVLDVVNSEVVKIQWLERNGKSLRYRLGKYDEVEVLALNGFAGGEWLSQKCYSIE